MDVPTTDDIVEVLEKGGPVTFRQLQAKFPKFPGLLKRLSRIHGDTNKLRFNGDWNDKDNLIIARNTAN